MVLICFDQERSEDRETPGKQKEFTWHIGLPLMLNDGWMGERFLEMTISFVFVGFSFRPDDETQLPIWSMSIWSEIRSSLEEMGLYSKISSA